MTRAGGQARSMLKVYYSLSLRPMTVYTHYVFTYVVRIGDFHTLPSSLLFSASQSPLRMKYGTGASDISLFSSFLKRHMRPILEHLEHPEFHFTGPSTPATASMILSSRDPRAALSPCGRTSCRSMSTSPSTSWLEVGPLMKSPTK